ncbi:Translation elongation factor EF1A/initiation factor IF2gamma family protein [Raphanus sativus]|nr:Translation elongation factor EF1A/initiation factor IF2gamma family protein [Raphanus sativus]
MDLEADIRALQLDSAEENNGVVVSEDHHPDGVEKLDKAEEGWLSFYTCCFTLWLLHRYNNKSWLREDPRFYDVIRSNADSYNLKDNLQESAPVPVEQQATEDHDQEMLLPVHNPAKAKEKAAQEKAAKEEAEEEAEANKKRHLNCVFIGHVDAGKSTIGGQILFLSGQVDDRQIQKYEKEAKDKSRESWYMAYIMDTNEEERAKGKTVEVEGSF